jgi:hypothetical protein
MELQMSQRSCGDCDVCCNILEVRELNKKPYCNCIHRAEAGGCGKYDSRPSICNEWSCSYILGLIPEDIELRPNKIGVMFYPVSAKNNDLNMSMYMAQEVWPNARNSKEAQELIALFKAKMLTMIRHYNSEKFTYVGPAEQVKEFELRHSEYMKKTNNNDVT